MVLLCGAGVSSRFENEHRDIFLADEVTVSVDEETGKRCLLIIENKACLYRGFWDCKHNKGSLPTSHCFDQTPRVGYLKQDLAERKRVDRRQQAQQQQLLIEYALGMGTER